MIWVGGRLVPNDGLKIDVSDRTFEHGLGLFETLRTQNGRAPLLDRHLARMERSARELGLPFDPVVKPDAKAVLNLVEAEGLGGDVLVRITLTGGLAETSGATLWMRVAPLPPPARPGGIVVAVGPWRVLRDDRFARFKSLNYWSRRAAFETARRLGFDEVLSLTDDGCVWEGSRTNLFAVRGATLITPSLDGPLVPGIMRGLVLELARGLSLSVDEAKELRRDDLAGADEVFLTNSVRGIVPVTRVVASGPDEATHQWPAPGPWTRRLALAASDRLWQTGETTP